MTVLEFGAYPPETIWKAQDLYCVDFLTYEKVAEHTGVSVPTLKRWGGQFGWRAKREELAQATSQIKINTVKARAKMLEQVIETGKAQAAFGAAALENLALEQAKYKNLKNNSEPIKIEAIKFESPAQAATLLEKVLNQKLGNFLATGEGLDLKALKDFKEALDFLAKMKGSVENENSILTVDTTEKIKKILGGDL